EALLMLPSEADRVGRHVELVLPIEREASRDEAIEPAVARLGPEREVTPRVPVSRHEKIHVIVHDEVVADVGHVALVAAGRPDDVVQPEPRHQDPAATSRPDVLDDERYPNDRAVHQL